MVLLNPYQQDALNADNIYFFLFFLSQPFFILLVVMSLQKLMLPTKTTQIEWNNNICTYYKEQWQCLMMTMIKKICKNFKFAHTSAYVCNYANNKIFGKIFPKPHLLMSFSIFFFLPYFFFSLLHMHLYKCVYQG